MAMSGVNSKSSATEQIIKFDCEEEATIGGKPCIDFQPDDRWQIKDEHKSPEKVKQNSKVNDVKNSSNGSARKLRSRSKPNQQTLNGESNSVSSDEEEKTVQDSSEKSKLLVNSTNECNNKTNLKRRISLRSESKVATDSKPPEKKSKVETNLSDSDKKCNDDDSNDKLSMPNLSPAANDCSEDESKDRKNLDDSVLVLDQDSEKSLGNNTDDSSKSSTDLKAENESIPKLEEFSPSDPIKIGFENANPEGKVKVEDSEVEVKTEKSEEVIKVKHDANESAVDQDSLQEVKICLKDEPSEDKTVKNVQEESIASSSNETNNSEIEVINLLDESKKSSEVSDEESDSEIQILNSLDSPKPLQVDFPSGGDFQGDFTLSAGYPYFNSLKEKISGFKAGDYKPVKFPHTGTLYLAENEVIIESPSLLVPLLIKETDQFPSEDKDQKVSDEVTTPKPSMISKRNFFQSSVGQFLINLGMSRVQEFYHGDMKRLKQKQLRKSPDDTSLEEAIKTHEKRQSELKEINAVFNFRVKRCQFCNFKSESRAVMEGHYLTPHISSRREYRCNFCAFTTRDPKEIMFHFEAIHSKKALVEFNVPFHECIFCSFQSHLKTKVNAHMNRCRKHFIPSQNLSPPFDFEFPGVTTKPVTIADVIAHRRLLLSSAKNQRLPLPDDNSPHGAYARKKLASVLSKITGQGTFPDLKNPNLMKQLMASQTQQLSALATGIQLPPGIVITQRPRFPGQQVRPVGRFPLPPRAITGLRPPPRRAPIYPNTMTSTATSQLTSSGISITPVTRPGGLTSRTNSVQGLKNVTLTPISSATNRNVSQKPGPPQPVALFSNIAGSSVGLVGQPPARLPVNAVRAARPSAPYQRLNTPPSQVVKGSSGNTFVMCEICDSYIKDLEELRSHMNWVHKVKIHPKMLVSRPPLNCQKCQWRFFTDQGLERHLLGAHGLVTTNMQEMANKNQDGGRCIICGAVFTYKLVSHMTQVHKVTLKPAHLSYKCTVCTATFTLYRLFESHVYNVHSGSAKRPADDTLLEPPAKKVVKVPVVTGPIKCKACGLVTENLQNHLISKHIKECSVKLCQILKCEKCLNSSGEMLVIRMDSDSSDSGSSDDDEDGDDDSDEEDGDSKSSESSSKTAEETKESGGNAAAT